MAEETRKTEQVKRSLKVPRGLFPILRLLTADDGQVQATPGTRTVGPDSASDRKDVPTWLRLGDVLVDDVTEGHPWCDSTSRVRQSHRSRKWGVVFLGCVDRSRGHSSAETQTKTRLTELQKICFKIIYSCDSAKFRLLHLFESFVVKLL